jgi:hypothetical protein
MLMPDKHTLGLVQQRALRSYRHDLGEVSDCRKKFAPASRNGVPAAPPVPEMGVWVSKGLLEACFRKGVFLEVCVGVSRSMCCGF